MKTADRLVLLHGFLGSPRDWEPTVTQLQSRLAIEVDCPNLWTDFLGPGCETWEAWLSAFAANYQSVAPFFLGGYSMGARLAMSIACRRPELLRGLILISGHPGLQSDLERSARLQDDRAWAENFLRKPWDEAMADWNGRAVFGGHRIEPEPDAFSAGELSRALEMFSLGKQPDFRACLRELTIPMTIIVGDCDEKFRRLAREDWAESATVTEIENCGHRVPHEKPDELAEVIASFVAMKSSPATDLA